MAYKRDLRVARTKKSITDAFVALLAKKPFNSITIQEISDQAAINRATFYAHFEDKYALMEKYTEEIFSELNDLVENRYPGGDSTDKSTQLSAMLYCFFEHIAAHAPYYKVIFLNDEMFQYRLKFESTLQNMMMEKLVRLKKSNYQYDLSINESLLDELFVKYMSNACIGIFSWWLEHDLIYSPRHMSIAFTKIATSNLYEIYGFDHDENKKRNRPTPGRNS